MATLGAVDRDNSDVEMAINFAKTSGTDKNGDPYYFIDLVLADAGALSASPELFAITGIRELSPLSPRPDKHGKMVYTFDEQRGGYTRFRKDSYGQWRYSIWDDPDNHNRLFLASHWDSGYWEIDDAIIEDQIYKLYEKLQEDAKKETPVQKKLIVLQNEYKGAENKRKRAIMDKIMSLISQHTEEILPTPKRGVERKKKRDKYRIPPTPEQLEKARSKIKEERPVVQKKTSVVRVDSEH